MTALRAETEHALDEFTAGLADAAFPVAVRYGLKGATVDGELALWRALRRTVAGQRRREPASADDLRAEWTATLYAAALRRGFTGSFLDLELALWRAVGEAAGRACEA